ncbi:hypothetical protein C8R21_10319 [Nitrosospira multiformis]|uniref:Uncharacterized protein n=1 Tax=Nitrosospira multiformis TaxID=1231 RepID=A0A2T5IFX9_9PROT|nr:hypothetical protein C8R21_10319 [Nitrosospira multiformis]
MGSVAIAFPNIEIDQSYGISNTDAAISDATYLTAIWRRLACLIFAKRGIGQRQRGRVDGVGGESLGNWSGCLAISSAWRICAGLWVRRPSARARDASLRRPA